MTSLVTLRSVPAIVLAVFLVCAPPLLHAGEPFVRANLITHPINTAADAPLASLSGKGRLHYALYAERGSDSPGNIVPDFSRAGYHGGGVALPAAGSLPVRATLSPAAGGDDHARIQQAIDTVGQRAPDARGVRGVVLLTRGRYTISRALVIRSGGVILRGEGRGSDGTIIHSTYTGRRGNIVEIGNPESSRLAETKGLAPYTITAERIPVGAMRIPLASTQGLNAGDHIASFNLTQRCYAEQARHSFVTGAKTPGPNVFLDCLAMDGSNDSGPHHRWATGTLYDNTRDDQLKVQNRRRSGSGHGWAGAQQMFWNTGSTHYVLQAPPHAMNWSVGRIGAQITGKFPPEESAGMVQLPAEMVRPRSLYLQQLQDRLGAAAVEAVTTPAQRHGRAWNMPHAQRNGTTPPRHAPPPG